MEVVLLKFRRTTIFYRRSDVRKMSECEVRPFCAFCYGFKPVAVVSRKETSQRQRSPESRSNFRRFDRAKVKGGMGEMYECRFQREPRTPPLIYLWQGSAKYKAFESRGAALIGTMSFKCQAEQGLG